MRRADVIIYGGTSAAIIAAVQVKKMGKSVIIVSPDRHFGGLSAGELGYTDTRNKEVISGLARDFYRRLYGHYQKPEAWNWEKREQFGNKGQGTPAIDGPPGRCGFLNPRPPSRFSRNWQQKTT